MSDWDNRMMFDRYLYDYMRKNNMNQTADIFKEEANVVQPLLPPEIDVTDGFLHEWWLTFYEMYRLQEPRNQFPGEGLNMMFDQQMVGARQQPDPSTPQYAMNQQSVSGVLTDSDSWFNTGMNAMGSSRSPLIGAERVSQGTSSSSHQHNLLAPKSVPHLPGNPANLPGQEVGCSVPAASRKVEDIATEESINTTDTIDGNCSGSCNMNTTSDASLKCKFNDDNVKSSSPHGQGNKDNADSSSSKLLECAATADDSKVHRGVESRKEGVEESKKQGSDIIRGFHVNCNSDYSMLRYIPYVLIFGTSYPIALSCFRRR